MALLWKVLGVLFVGVGIVGYFTPVMPGTIFLIIALFCFRKASNERLVDWMLNNRYFGPTLRDWDEDKSVTLKTKALATVVMIGFITYSILQLPLWAKIATGALGIIGLAYLWTRKTKVQRKPDSSLPIVA